MYILETVAHKVNFDNLSMHRPPSPFYTRDHCSPMFRVFTRTSGTSVVLKSNIVTYTYCIILQTKLYRKFLI